MNKNLNLKKSFALASMLLFALIISACGPSATNTTKTNGNTNAGSNTANANTSVATACDDAQVIKDMQATIDAKYPLLKARMTHLSAYSKDCSVSLMGYTDTLGNFKDFYKVASDTFNVQKVNIDKLFIDSVDVSKPSGGQCPAGQQACGDICVPLGQCWSKNFDSDSNSNVNTNRNSVTNSYSNSNKVSKP
jgi:hypothetical protein